MRSNTKKINPIKQYVKVCKKCHKQIKGYSQSQVNFNMKLHLQAHKRIAKLEAKKARAKKKAHKK